MCTKTVISMAHTHAHAHTHTRTRTHTHTHTHTHNHFRLVFINTTSIYRKVEGGGWWVAMKWQVTVMLSNFHGEMA